MGNNQLLLDKVLWDISGYNNELFMRLWEFIAYTIFPEYRNRFIFCLIGVKGSGKSMLLKVIEKLLTPSLVINMSIKNMVGSRFALSELVGKRVCIASDEGDLNVSVNSAAMLKRISGGGETITADVKCHNQATFVSTAKLLIASNNAVHISARNADTALYERIVVAPFLKTIPIEYRDSNLEDKILVEKDAIATKAFWIFKQLQRNFFKFSGDELEFQKMAEYAAGMCSTDPLISFSANYCKFDENAFTSTSKLFNAFQMEFPFSTYNDVSAFSRAFQERNGHRISPFREHADGSNARGYKGVSIKNI